MKVTVEAVRADGETARVRFSSACGIGEAGWVGPTVRSGDVREVEMEVPGSFRANVDLIPCEEPIGLREEGESTIMVGRVTLVDEPYVRLDLGCGGVDLEVEDASLLVGKVCKLRVPFLRLFDARM